MSIMISSLSLSSIDLSFRWLFRTRIRISVTSEGGLGESTPLHSSAMNREPSTTRWEGRGRERDRELVPYIPF